LQFLKTSDLNEKAKFLALCFLLAFLQALFLFSIIIGFFILLFVLYQKVFLLFLIEK